MRRTVIALAVMLGFPVPEAGATAMTTYFIELPGVSLETCLGRAHLAIGRTGLGPLPSRAVETVWGQRLPDQIYSVMCLRTPAAVVISGAGPDLPPVDSTVNALAAAMQRP